MCASSLHNLSMGGSMNKSITLGPMGQGEGMVHFGLLFLNFLL